MTTVLSTRQTNMRPGNKLPMKVALLDLYDGQANQGIPAIHGLVSAFNKESGTDLLDMHSYDIRKSGDSPGLAYDIYISSGGPGSPFDGLGSRWEATYFKLIDEIWRHNERVEVKRGEITPKYVLFICHSFQMMCRHFEMGEVVQRKSQSFGVFKAHQSKAGHTDVLFNGLRDPFYVADFRDWQVIQPKLDNFNTLGASILAFEKKRPHVPLERALMGARISKELVGVQFHPEANPTGMLVHFQEEKRRKAIIECHGVDKFEQIIRRLQDPDFLLHTYQTIIPNFLGTATASRFSEAVEE